LTAGYFFTLPAENLRAGAIFMRDALLTPLFRQDELERERPVVLGELDRAEARPVFHLHREVFRRLWKTYFSRKNTLGDRDVIVSATREQMQLFRDHYYVPNNAALLFGDGSPIWPPSGCRRLPPHLRRLRAPARAKPAADRA
jgi:zinc protease